MENSKDLCLYIIVIGLPNIINDLAEVFTKKYFHCKHEYMNSMTVHGNRQQIDTDKITKDATIKSWT